MDSINRVRNRIIDAVISGVLTLVLATFASAMIESGAITDNALSSELYLAFISIAFAPLLLTLLGWAIAVYRAGIFGFIGFLFEWGGVNSLLNNPDGSDLGMIVFGAILIVFGTFVWSWKPVLEYVFQSRNNQFSSRRRRW